MKKIYQKPVTELVHVEMQQVMNATSEQLGIGGSTNSAAGAESRDFDDWDD